LTHCFYSLEFNNGAIEKKKQIEEALTLNHGSVGSAGLNIAVFDNHQASLLKV
jgi:hypothetical protein